VIPSISMTYATSTSDPAHSPLQWLAELQDAIRTEDDQVMWRLLEQHEDQAEAHGRLATNVARLAYTIAGRSRFSEIFLTPVIEFTRGAQLGNAAAWRQADYCIGEALDLWLPSKTRKTVFAQIRPYDWIGTWKPSVLRCHLKSAVPGARGPKLRFETEDIQCPDEVPRLGFICMVLTSDRGWPQLAAADSVKDARFKDVVGYALQTEKSHSAPAILTPDRVQFAVADGLCLWLHLANETVPITGWVAAPVAANPDVVKFTLRFDHAQVPLSQFTVRKHQLGLEGLGSVVEMLASIAPTMDQPMDMPRIEPKPAVLDLT
jgi:hypothetical protein